MKRETFGSRLGFILVSAGCAVGIGNVWKFPYMCGQFGGAAFILIYLVFLLIMGIPVMVCEFGVGRASRHSVAAAYETLEPKGTKVAYYKMDRHHWMLFSDDVLYYGWWMDAVLLCQKLQWRFRRCGYGDGIGWI